MGTGLRISGNTCQAQHTACVYTHTRLSQHVLQEHMGFVLIIGTFISYCGAIAVIGAVYKFWAPHPSCGLNIFFITFTLVLALIFTLISVSPWRLETAGLLTSGVVFLYCAWIVWSALASEPDSATCTYTGAKGTTAEKVSESPGHAQT